ncbi:MAG: RNA methyltransferase [Myxococcales bacterium]|nr:RNA methyltransferase [Myxococcales bacterium]
MKTRADLAFAVIQPGLEAVLVDELGSLGISARPTEGGALFEATPGALHAVHLHGRTPTRVWVRLGSFSATHLDALAKGVQRLPWRRFVHRRQDLAIRVSTHHSRLRFRDRISKKVRHAVRDALRSAPARRSPPHAALVLVRVVNDRVEISVDASGDALYRRGWRTEVGDAPLRENLAAAVLRLVGWRGHEPLVDPMCGSGTFCVEAATVCQARPPGIRRSFAFESWPEHDAAAFSKAKAKARRLASSELDVDIVGADSAEDAIAAARANAGRAGVARHVQFARTDVRDLVAPPTPGLVVANPPWGERLPNANRAYRSLGLALRQRFVGWRVAVLVPHMSVLSRLGLRLERVAQFRAGGIRVSLCTGRVST